MPMLNRKTVGFLLGLLFSSCCLAAEPVALNPAHPERYVVVKGDTLWDIAERFLRDPWRWPEVWQVNQQIENPHLIYPGDTIVLTYLDGRPRLTVERKKPGDVRLSPRVRSEPVDLAIPAIPVDAIQPFLSRPFVMEKNELEAAPYVVSFVDEHIVGGAGNSIYVRAIESDENQRFEVVRPGDPYKDGDTGEILGYEALFIGEAALRRTGDPATLLLARTELETLVGDRLLPVADIEPQFSYFPKPPDSKIQGNIISVLKGVTQIGQFQIVVLDRGKANGLAVGDVLKVFQRGAEIPDPVTSNPFDTITLPDEEAGVLMVFRTFPRVSFGLIMSAIRPIHVLDRVRNP